MKKLVMCVAVLNFIQFVDSKTSKKAFQFTGSGLIPCSPLINTPIQLKNFDFMPDPIVTPGTMVLTATMDVVRTVYPPITLDIAMDRLFMDTWLQMPCLYGYFGSCTYQDVCQLFTMTPPICPSFLQKKMICKCPIEKNTYVLDAVPIELIDPGLFAVGKYRAFVQARSWMLGELMCYVLNFQVVKAN